MSSDSIHGLDR